jgi:hypothetical protein
MQDSNTFQKLSPSEKQRLLEKLSKLKALAECQTGNVNETATAAATMTKIMLEYQIEMADLESQQPLEGVVEEELSPGSTASVIPLWQQSLANVLAEVNHCMAFSSTKNEYFFWKRSTQTRLYLIGSPTDIANTRRIFDFCVSEVERLCRAWGVGKDTKLRNDFKRGAGRGIADKVRRERDEVMRQESQRAAEKKLASRALALFDQKRDAVQTYAQQRLNLQNKYSRVRGAAPNAFQAGYQAGSQIDLDGSQPGPRALPPERGALRS